MKMKYISVALFLAISSATLTSRSAELISPNAEVSVNLTRGSENLYEVIETVKEITASIIGGSPDFIQNDDRFFLELGMDSLDMLELEFRCNEYFCISVDITTLPRLATVRDLAEKILVLLP